MKGDERRENDRGEHRRRREVGAGDAERIAEEKLAEAWRYVRRERQEGSEPEQRGDGDGDGKIGADSAKAPGQRNGERGHQQSGARADHQ